MTDTFDKELDGLVQAHAHDLSRKLATEVTALLLRTLGLDSKLNASGSAQPSAAKAPRAKRAAKATVAVAAPAKRAAKAPAAKAAPAKAAPAKGAKAKASAGALDKVLAIVSSGQGVSVKEVVQSSGLDAAAVSKALKSLREDKRIFMGGNRVLARYATAQATADRASQAARKG